MTPSDLLTDLLNNTVLPNQRSAVSDVSSRSAITCVVQAVADGAKVIVEENTLRDAINSALDMAACHIRTSAMSVCSSPTM